MGVGLSVVICPSGEQQGLDRQVQGMIGTPPCSVSAGVLGDRLGRDASVAVRRRVAGTPGRTPSPARSATSPGTHVRPPKLGVGPSPSACHRRTRPAADSEEYGGCMSPSARLSLVAFYRRDPPAHGAFDGATALLAQRAVGDRVTPRGARGSMLVNRPEPDRAPPGWPISAYPHQAHLCVDVDDLDPGGQRAPAAIDAQVEPGDGQTVFIDPAGHPFCIVLDDE